MLRTYIRNVKLFSRNARFFLVGGLFNGFGMSVFMLLFNLYLKEYGYSETQIGRILSIGAWGATLIAIPTAFLLERIHVKKILVVSTLLAAFSYGLVVFYKDIKLILIFSFLANMFITVFRVAIAPFIMRNSTKQERIYLFSINSALSMLASLLGFLFGGFLPQIFQAFSQTLVKSYELSLYLAAFISLLSVFPFFRIRQKPIPQVQHYLLAQIRSYNWPLLIRLMIPRILVGMGAGLVIPFMNLYFKNIFGLGSATIGSFFSLLQVFMFLAMISAPLLTVRYGMLKSIVFTELLSIPFMFILAVTNYLPLAVIAFVFRGSLMNMNIPISSNFEMELVRKNEQPFTNALATISWNGAWAVSTVIGGRIIDKYSFQYSFFVTIVLYFLSALLYYAFFKKYTTGIITGSESTTSVKID